MKELTLPALREHLETVQSFIESALEEQGCPANIQFQISVSLEELFVNIASYAYKDGVGDVTVRYELTTSPRGMVFQLIDHGVPFDPLARQDVDVTLSAQDRSIGGLGIHMVKKMMDRVEYTRKDGQNILTVSKQF